ncbi:neuraminidase-like domain-containing protein [Actinoplanes sp. NBRC 103695]|uniref:Tc toxin subunit A-related protein n=1 Tax=Actinoplanes sp. NBRC 103695 TaxID=3032202 RepID=UPI0024A31FF4|nr:neuraminidase-like domain-containing protein [Actinoplanes sp. NBRC 103695]GLY94446.1 hypothetical protein Acsp02_17020 [Actinoplanes sp. NBRC 103695]
MPTTSFTVTGTVTDASNGRLPGASVTAWSPGRDGPDVSLGRAETDNDGRYRIEIEVDGHLDTVGVDVHIDGRDVGRSRPHRVGRPETVIDVQTDFRPEPEPDHEPRDRVVFGVVRDAFGAPLAGVSVQAFDRDLRSEQSLGRAETDDEGRYAVAYSAAQFRRAEKDSADLVLAVTDGEGEPLLRSTVHYNAPAQAEIDLDLDGVTFAGPSEWEVQTGALTPLLAGVAPADLREDEQHQDVSFLSGETGFSQLTIGTWAACWRLAERTRRDDTPLPPEALFAFLAQGEPSIFRESMLDDIRHPERITLMEDALLRALATLTPQRQREILTAALTRNLIPARLRPAVDDLLATLQQIRLRAAADSGVGGGKGTVGQLLDVVGVPAPQRDAVLAVMAEHRGSLAGLWAKLATDPQVPEATVTQVRGVVELGALTRNHVPLVGLLAPRITGGELSRRDLARYSADDWLGVFATPGPDGQPVGVPDNIDGDTPEQRQATFASILGQQFERAYPTAVLAAKINRSEARAPQLTARVARFLDTHPDLHLDRVRIDQYLAGRRAANEATGDDTDTDDALLTELSTVQRVFKLSPTFTGVDAMLTKGIESAQQVYFMGQAQFAETVADTPVTRIEARSIYRRAENVYALALTTFADFSLAVNRLNPAAVPDLAPDAETRPVIDALPNLRSLFGSLDYCECKGCRSVYSPAAHFVDVLRFLGDRGSQGTAVNAGKTVQQVLLQRRPDLGDIELSCENTNTPLPYIDLVNEILEDVVAPPDGPALPAGLEAGLAPGPISPEVLAALRDAGVTAGDDARVAGPDIRGQWTVRDASRSYRIFRHDGGLSLLATRQTTGTAAELRASPEHRNPAAYAKLAGEVFPLRLPFDLAAEQTRGYLDQLGVPYPRLLELFGPESGIRVDCAVLGVDEGPHGVVTATTPGRDPWDFWGLDEQDNAVPHPDAPGDPAMTVTGTWLEVLAQVPVLLHRAGLSYRELLEVLDCRYPDPAATAAIVESGDCDVTSYTVTGLDEGVAGRLHRFVRLQRRLGLTARQLDVYLAGRALDDTALSGLAGLHRLKDRTGADWPVLVAMFDGFDDHEYPDHTGDGPARTLYQQLFRNRLTVAAGTLPDRAADVSGTVADHVPGLLAGLRLSDADLDVVLAGLGRTRAGALDATLLGRLHGTAELARGLGLRVREYDILRRVHGGDPLAGPAEALRFAELADAATASGFTVPELGHLLIRHVTANSGVALQDRDVAAFLTGLRQGLAEIAGRLRQQADETDAAYVTARLGTVPALAADADLVAALAIVDGGWTGPAAERTALIDRYFAGVLPDPAEAHTKLAALPAGETPAERQVRVDARFAYVAPHLQRHLLRRSKDLHVVQQAAAFLDLAEPSADLLLQRTGLRTVLNDPSLLDPAAGVDEAALPAVYPALRHLHRIALLIRRFAMTPAEVAWWLTPGNAEGLGWIRPAELGTATPVPADRWLAMRWFFAWKAALPASDRTAFDVADEVLDVAAPSAGSITALARLTGWDEAGIGALARAFGWLGPAGSGVDQVKQRLASMPSLRRLARCFEVLARLGVTAERAAAWAGTAPDATVADEVTQALKARYDLPQWLEANRPVQDALREARRDVLVDWLVAHPDKDRGHGWTDADGLYSHFLIDVAMSACALTSRLKQATASVQLFVQRVLLDLENDVLASTVADPKWKQWQWMRRYRVWEANRKVFLYPENWIEPELRDEKSPFFLDLEHELQQNDVTARTVEDAYRTYLGKLDRVANLEIRAMFEERIGEETILHVVGRTRGSKGAEYFYRTRVNRARWTAWQPVKLEINADHLTIGMHDRRLYLLWPQLLEKAADPNLLRTPAENSTFTVEPPRKYWEVRLFSSELKDGGWTPKVLSDSAVRVWHSQAGGDLPQNLGFRVRTLPQIRAHLFLSTDPATLAPTAVEGFEKLGQQVAPVPLDLVEYLVSPAESRFHGDLLRHSTASLYFYYGSVTETGKPHQIPAHQNALAIRVLGAAAANRTWTVLDSQASGFAPAGSFFTWDDRRTYFVDYTHHTETTYTSRAWHTWNVSTFRFQPHYHPFVPLFTKELNTWGIHGLLNRRIQVSPGSVPGSPPPFDFASYRPDSTVPAPHPVEEVDFSYAGAYSPYNWELFFHVPMFIASRLAANQRFEEALHWFHFIFDPTGTDTATTDPDTPQQKFWITKPFFETTTAGYRKSRIENIMLAIAKGDAELRAQVEEWRDHPFNPHLIARMRTVAYQKNVLIKYVQTLIAWGDQLFGQDTIESINEATQLYVLAATILGSRPKSVPRSTPDPARTLYQLQADDIDPFGNVLREVENLLPTVPATTAPAPDRPELPRLELLYFGIPNNEKLLTLWDTVDDRLFKIRHCMNLAGTVRQLPLFEPPIDPALLVRAAAAGLDVGSVLDDIGAPMPAFRFRVTLRRAQEACAAVTELGAAMLAALEKRDAETFAALRSQHEIALLDVLRDVRSSQVDEAKAGWEAAQRARDLVELRRTHHQRLLDEGLNAGEATALTLSGLSLAGEAAVAIGYILSGGLKLIPSFVAGAAGFGGTPTVSASMGGQQIGDSAEMAVATLRSLTTLADKGAAMATVLAGHARRAQDWKHQADAAATELPGVDKQILAAEIRHRIAERDLRHHDRRRDTAAAEDDVLRSKFTDAELYDWMVGQLSAVYFQSYQLAYDLAKQAERSLRYELGLTESGYVRRGHWDNLRKGLLAGERLAHDLRRLDAAYHDLNRREYELTKHVPLSQLDPVALLQLQRNGECFITVPEATFDLDHPGHYFRRLKSVSLSVPCVAAGPYGTVAATLTLLGDSLRKDATLRNGEYPRDPSATDTRFRDGTAPVQSIATSSPIDDSGLFELRFDDERYLPFEGAGAISAWHLRLGAAAPRLDPAAITDVVLHLRYTAREGGGLLRREAAKDIGTTLSEATLAAGRHGLYRVFDLVNEYRDEFHRFLHPARPTDEQVLLLGDLSGRLPWFTHAFTTKKVRAVEVAARMADGATYEVVLEPLAAALNLAPDTAYRGLHRTAKDLNGSEAPITGWTLKLRKAGAADFRSLPPDAVTELFLIIAYTVEGP